MYVVIKTEITHYAVGSQLNKLVFISRWNAQVQFSVVTFILYDW